MSPESPSTLTPVQLVGFLCWRSGLILVASYGSFRVARLVLRSVEIPEQLKVGLSLTLAGSALVLASLIQERAHDARLERGLSE